MVTRFGRTLLFCLLLSCLGCSAPQAVRESVAAVAHPVQGERAAAAALEMEGRPYTLSGETPAGFDCSGLVRYSYLAEGLDLPHRTLELKELTRTVPLAELRKGDLVFFTERGRKYSHVGIYEGDSLFIHAASSGKTVRIDSLNDPYWKKHFLDGRRPVREGEE